MSNPRVLMIGWELPPHNSGGLGIACEAIADELLADGWHLQMTLPYMVDDFDTHLPLVDCHDTAWDGMMSKRADGAPFAAYERPKSGTQLPLPGSWMEDRVEEYAQKVLDYARKHVDEFDVVHAHDWMTMPAAMLIKQELGKPFVAHIHSTEYDRSLSEDRNSYIAQCEIEGMELADKVLAVSYYTKRLLVEKYGIDPDKIDVVHNGVVAHLQETSGVKGHFAGKRPVIVFMGRLTMQKGPDYFLELAQKVLQKRPDALFIVSGMGDMYQHLLLSNAHKSLSAHVLFSGFVRGGAQNAILRRADVFVMPSVSEPFGLVAAEAAMMNTPVIASKSSGVVEIIGGSPKFDFWDTDAMAKEVIHLLEDREYRSVVIEDQLRRLRKNTWNKMVKKIEKVYTQVADENSKA
ncbi:glycosyltransferase family 4 protein [bacterium]|nr:glycosyltransferase family 4 protein [bacterium]